MGCICVLILVRLDDKQVAYHTFLAIKLFSGKSVTALLLVYKPIGDFLGW